MAVEEQQAGRYPAYQPTGVEWIPEIPAGWALYKLKIAIDVKDGTHETPNYVEKSGYSIPLITSKDIKDSRIFFDEAKHISESDYKEINRRSDVEFADVIMPMIGTVGGAAIVKSKSPFSIKNVALFKTSKSKLLPEFLYYILESSLVKQQFDLLLRGGVQNFVSLDILRNLIVPKISSIEQRAIARFLDDKTAQLDHLIIQKQQMLELLREERAALLNHAVTKGLNAAAPLRDSGVEWLGEVPAHWEIRKLKWIAEIQGGIALSSGKKLDNPVTLPYLRVANVQDGYLDLKEIKTVEVEADQVTRYSLRNGDLLMNEGGDNDKLGRGCVWQGEIESCLHQNHVFAVRLHDGYDPNWLNLITATEGARTHFLTRAKQSTNLASISSSNIKELPVLLPPPAEQQAIMAAVAEQTNKINETTATINQEIALLQEYRAALIAEAVTGQIDVRHYEPAAAVLM